MAEGLKEGKEKGKIDAVIAFAKAGMSLKLICRTLGADEAMKRQTIDKLNNEGVKYTE